MSSGSEEESPQPLLPNSPAPESPHNAGPSLRIGQCLGPYEIIDQVGAGGMGEVYRAHQTQLGRDVAIKTLPWRSQISPDARRRFEREAQLSASLAHRNVVAVHDFCEADGIAFVVEELLDGTSWRSIIRNHAGVTAPDAARMIADAASGVAAAHAAGLVHRDLKPENLFETRAGETKVLDFGLARLLDPTPSSPEGGTPSSGVVLGTPTYTAPECLRGGPADRRSDVFALACSAYELLAGANPFRRANTGDTIVALLKETPEPLARNLAGLPQALAAVIERGLSKQPEDRPTADDIAREALAAAREGPSQIRQLTKAERRNPLLFGLVAAVVVGLALAFVAYLRFRPVPVAVILFDSSGLDAELRYVGTAISERLNERLSKASGLAVLTRLGIGQSPVSDARVAARHLGARRVITGKLTLVQAALVADVQILDVSSGERQWERKFGGSIGDLREFEDRIANGVATALGVSLPGNPPGRVPLAAIDPEAHRLYAEGRYYWFRRTPNDLYKAINLFTHALSLDPDYALAHAGLSRAYGELSYNVPGVSSKETKVVARRSAERSLALDPNLVGGIIALADVEGAAWNRDLAHDLYKRAMALDPTDSDAYLGEAADVLVPRGRFREARAVLRKGLGLDVSSLARESLARISYYERDFDRALREFSEVLETDPRFVFARYRVGQVLLAKGEPEKALAPLWEADKQAGGLAKGRAVIVYALASAGRLKEAGELLADLLKEREKNYVSATLIALAQTGLGQKDAAFDWLQQGC
ncbi:MAG: protein kinase, partial [Vicinamibacteria bacterium]|nr:protein kinase [Vicinamibacteria bacterium]